MQTVQNTTGLDNLERHRELGRQFHLPIGRVLVRDWMVICLTPQRRASRFGGGGLPLPNRPNDIRLVYSTCENIFVQIAQNL